MRDQNENIKSGCVTPGDAGFSLIEVSIALLIIMVALLGVFFTFTYAITYNAGNNSRAQALAVLQQEVEIMRSAKFTSTYTDPLLYGGQRTRPTVIAANGYSFSVVHTVDNDPLTPGPDYDESVNPTLKEVTITVTLDYSNVGWQTAVPATVILRRTRGN